MNTGQTSPRSSAPMSRRRCTTASSSGWSSHPGAQGRRPEPARHRCRLDDHQGQREIVARQVEAALAAGARALTGGSLPDGPGLFYPPTVLVDVTDDMEVMVEETFGPVLPIVKVSDLDKGIRRANASRFGLTASGWTRSAATAARLQRELEAGVVTITSTWSPSVSRREPGRPARERRRSRPRRVRFPRGCQRRVRRP